MAKDMLMWDETLFRDPEVFEIDYIPEQFNHRDAQIRELTFQVKPGLRGARPLNTVCRGLPGTGKTTSVKKIFAAVEETTQGLVPVHVNCQIDNTRYTIFSQIYRRIIGHLPPSTGASFKQVLDAIARNLVKEKQVLLVALDDANYLLYENEINHVLYPLLRSHETYPGFRAGVIAIVSDMSVSLQSAVDARVASVFRPTEIYFPPYSEEEIRGILKERVLQGLYPNVIRPKVLDVVVEQTMKAGDLRVGIDLIKRATLNAEKDARRFVKREDVCKAYEISQYLHLTFSIKALKEDERQLLQQIAEMSICTDQEMSSGAVYEFAKEQVNIRYTRYHEMLRKLDALRILNLHFRKGRGRTRLISLRYNPECVLEHLRLEQTI